MLINGEDLGWLLNAVYQLPCIIPTAPGHRPPIYLIMKDLERFRAILHLQDWSKLLADGRMRLFAGPCAFEDFRRSLVEESTTPAPRIAVTVDPTIWPPNLTLDAALTGANSELAARFAAITCQLQTLYTPQTSLALTAKYQTSQPLRVLGITSRYTTFLQYSMRDWLEAFSRQGHQTRLVIENEDHEIPNRVSLAGAVAEFKPDLVVIIDHFRDEFTGLPPHIPAVMWVQDRLPNIYCAAAGQRQGPLDYVIGYSRVELTQKFGYPASRFMPAMPGVNEARFSPSLTAQAELDPYRCDVSFVSTCVMPAEQIIREEADRIGTPLARRLLDDLLQRLSAIYEAGGSITTSEAIRDIISQALVRNAVSADVNNLVDLFTHRVNNSLFRHQAIGWVAEMGVNLHLYGKGWEKHPSFARYARGHADNQKQLPLIYQASTINLQITPFGAVHQRLLDGLGAGGFFLLRSVAADELELLRRDMWQWCRRQDVRSGAEMVARRDKDLSILLKRYAEIGAVDPSTDPDYCFAALEECALADFTRTANTLWPDSHRVTFSTKEQLQAQVRHFLAAPQERQEIVRSMRQRVLETHTYEAITRRMLNFITRDLAGLAREDARSLAA